jgi:hypothetical protein
MEFRVLAGGSHGLAFAIAIWNTPAARGKPECQVFAGNGAMRQMPLVAVALAGLTDDRARPNPVRQRERRLLSATPLRTIGPETGLAALGAINVQDSDPLP